MKKKIIIAVSLVMAAITLVVTTVLVTIAYLTASSAVSNVFTIGDVEIVMFENKVDENGKIIADPSTEVDSNSYHLIPGTTYDKNPTIRVTSKLEQDDMYLFVKSSNQIREIEAANVDNSLAALYPTMRQQMEANGWVEYVMSGDGIEIVWVYGVRNADGTITPTAVDPTTVQTRGDGSTGPAGEIRLCEEFTITSNKNVDISLYGAAKVNFTAFAIQTSGMNPADQDVPLYDSTVRIAWENIKATFPYEGGIVNPKNPYNQATGEDAYAPVPKN